MIGRQNNPILWTAMDELRFAYREDKVDAKLRALSLSLVCNIVDPVNVYLFVFYSRQKICHRGSLTVASLLGGTVLRSIM